MSSSATLSGAAKRKKRKLQAQRNKAEKKIPKISNLLLCVRPAPDPENDSTNDLDLLLDDDQGKLT